MPRFEFREENIRKNDYDYPRFKLEKGETSRIALLEDPWGEYVHTLRKPKLVNGRPVMEIKKRKDGTPYEVNETEFVSQTLCTGDPGILREDGSDPKSCAICAEAVRSDKFPAPKLRYAVHVVKYDTRPDGTVKEPFGATTEIWGFTERVFAELYAFKKEWEDLRVHDLIVHREENTMLPGIYKIQVSKKSEWSQDKKRQQHIKDLLAPENLAPDLAIFCGTRKSEAKTGYDIQAVNEAWATAQGGRTVSAEDRAVETVGSLSLDKGLDDLFSKPETDEAGWAVPAEEDAPVSPATSLADLGISDDAVDDSDDGIDAILQGLRK